MASRPRGEIGDQIDAQRAELRYLIQRRIDFDSIYEPRTEFGGSGRMTAKPSL